MQKSRIAYVIGPVSTPEKLERTKREFKVLVERWKLTESAPSGFIGTHFWANTDDNSITRKERNRAITDAQFIVYLPGTFSCLTAQEDRYLARWLKKDVEFSERMRFGLTEPESKNLFDKLIFKADSFLKPLMTNPQKL